MTSPRYLFGSGASDFAIAPPSRHGGFVVSAPSLTNGTLWSSSTDGVQYTDLRTVGDGPISTVSTDANGSLVPFYGPAGVDGAWLDFGAGGRAYIQASVGTGSRVADLLGDATAAQAAVDARVPAVGDSRYPIKSRGPVLVADYAVGDGITDDTANLNAALAAGAGGRVVFPKGGTYRVSDRIALPSRTTIEGNNSLLDFSSMATATVLDQRIAVGATGTLGGDLTIANPITQWSRTITGISDTGSLVAGDLVLIENDERPVPGMTRTDRDKGELAIILSVDSASQVTLVSGALFNYGTTLLKMRRVAPVEDIVVAGLRLKLGGVGSGHNGIRFQYGRNITVRDCVVDGAEDTGVTLTTVFGGKVSGCAIRNSTSPSALGNTGYGVAVLVASKHTRVESNTFYNCRHFVAGGGQLSPVYTDVVGNHGVKSIDYSYDCHETAMWWTFEGNTSVSGAAGGFIIRGQHITVKDNRVFDTPGFAIKAATFDGVTEQRGITVSGNRVVRAGFGMSVDGQAAGGEPNSLKYNVQINGNYLLDAGPNPILLRHFDGAEVHGNTVVGSSAGGTSHAIYILGISGTQSTSLTMVGNHVRDSGASAIRVTLVDDVSITGGVCAAPGANGIDLTTCNRTSVSGVEIRTPGQNGILLSGGSVHNLSGATVSGGAGSTFDALRVTGTSDVTVAGGYYASARWAIFSTTTDYVSITGVNARAAFNAGRISVDATNKSVVNNLV